MRVPNTLCRPDPELPPEIAALIGDAIVVEMTGPPTPELLELLARMDAIAPPLDDPPAGDEARPDPDRSSGP